MTTGRGVGALVLASLLWGTTGTAASFLPDAISPVATGAATMTLGGAALFVLNARGSVRVLLDPAARGWVVLGALGVFAYPLAFYSGMNLAGVAVGNVVALGSGPIFAALLEWLVDGDRPGQRWIVATALAVAGIIALPYGVVSEATEQGGAIVAGMLLGLVAGAAYALFTFASSTVITDLRRAHQARAVMGAMFGVGAAILAPVLIVTGAPILQHPSSIAISLYLAVGPMFVAYLLFGFALGTVRSSSATTITLLEPIVATSLAIVVVGERLSLLGWVAMVLIMVGVFVVASARHTDAGRHPS